MAFKDMREFLVALEAKGELQRIKAEVDWDEEIGGIAQEAVVKHKPALLFENIKGYKDTHGKRLAINSMATLTRVNIALGLAPDTHPKETLLFFKERINNRIKPRLVNGGTVKENIEKGNKVNILEFPVPKLHAEDGGRYFGTWHLIVVKDPDSGWINSAMYRAMVHDEKRIGLFMTPVQQWWQIARKYAAKGQRSLPQLR